MALFVAVGIAFILTSFQSPSTPRWGVTFSPTYARFLGLDAGEAYHAVLSDLSVKAIRLPLYWDQIEKTKGQYDWSEADWYMWDAKQHGVAVTLAIGARVPRWPECHIPVWAGRGSQKIEVGSQEEKDLLIYVQAAAEHFKDNTTVERWQVENEPGFTAFGDCPTMSRDTLKAEIAAVRALDTRPVQITTSGEMQSWGSVKRLGDLLGISIYRTTWNPWFGYFTYPLPPAFYRLRALFSRLPAGKVVVSELQAEPWFPDTGISKDIRDDYHLFTADDLKANVEYVGRTGLPEAYLWGVEWWYAMKKAGDSRLWDAARDVFQGKTAH